MAQDIVNKLLDADVLFFLIGGLIAIVAIVFGMATSMIKAMARERSRREIAAYIAEGSMTPEQGERLMAAGESRKNA
ncbi:MAG: hypothetical protein ACF8R7_00025 [Phycisphaerales bacterium JB039]